MIRHLVAALCSASLMGACTTLTVGVDILDPTEVMRIADTEYFTQAAYEISRSNDASIGAEVARLRAEHADVNDSLAHVYDLKAEAVPVGPTQAGAVDVLLSTANQLRSQLDAGNPLATTYEEYERLLREQSAIIRSVAGASPVDELGRLKPGLAAALRARQLLVDPLETAISASLEEARMDAKRLSDEGGAGAAQASAAATKASQTQVVLNTLTGGRTLTRSRYAHAVMVADKTYWRPDFNRAYADGRFGNSEIVIKVDQVGEFTVKGVQFDPAKVATIAGKVGVQSLLLAAKLAGAPVQSASVSDTAMRGNALVGTGDAQASRDTAILQRGAHMQARSQSLRNLAIAILAEEKQISGSDQAARDSADKAIKDEFGAYQDIIKLMSLQ